MFMPLPTSVSITSTPSPSLSAPLPPAISSLMMNFEPSARLPP